MFIFDLCSTNKSSFLSPHGDILHTRLYLSHLKRREKKIKRESRILRDRPTSDCMGVEFTSKKEGLTSLREKSERRTWESARFAQ